MEVKELIRKIRTAHLLDQEEFGKKLGVTGGTICNYEKGSRKPRMRVIREIINLAREKKIKAEYEDFI